MYLTLMDHAEQLIFINWKEVLLLAQVVSKFTNGLERVFPLSTENRCDGTASARREMKEG